MNNLPPYKRISGSILLLSSAAWIVHLNNVNLKTNSSVKYRSHCESKIQPQLVFVKYGGSAITAKSKYETVNDEMLAKTAEQLREIKMDNPSTQHVIVHGAGDR